jgi:hypothetical protein
MLAMLHIHTRHLEYQAEAQSESSAMNPHIFYRLQGESYHINLLTVHFI